MRQTMAVVLTLLVLFGLCGCAAPAREASTDPPEAPAPTQPPQTQPAGDDKLISGEKVIHAAVTSQPGDYDQSFYGSAAMAIGEYLRELRLIADLEEDPGSYAGMTWVISLAFESGETETVYHFGNRFIRTENGPWYQLSYEEASRFGRLLDELTASVAEAPIPSSDEALEDFLAQYSDDVYRSLYTLDGLSYGRILSSAGSPEEAVGICARKFTSSSCTVVECEVIYESELLYGVHVEWDYFNDGEFVYRYEENVICFKKTVADITARDAANGIEKSYRIHDLREEVQTRLALYLFFHENALVQLIDYEVRQEGQLLTVTVYAFDLCYGDWGIDDEYTFTKQEICIDQTDGSILFREPLELLILYRDNGYGDGSAAGE